MFFFFVCLLSSVMVLIYLSIWSKCVGSLVYCFDKFTGGNKKAEENKASGILITNVAENFLKQNKIISQQVYVGNHSITSHPRQIQRSSIEKRKAGTRSKSEFKFPECLTLFLVHSFTLGIYFILSTIDCDKKYQNSVTAQFRSEPL